MVNLRRVVSIFLLIIMVLSVPVTAADTGQTTQDSTPQASSDVEKLNDDINIASQILKTLNENKTALNVSVKEIQKLNQSITTAREQLNSGDLESANATLINYFWNPLKELMNNITKDLNKEYTQLSKDAKACSDKKVSKGIQSDLNEVKSLLDQIDKLISEGNNDHSKFSDALSKLLEVRWKLDKIKGDIEKCPAASNEVEKKITSAESALQAIKENRKFLDVDNKTLSSIEGNITFARKLLNAGNVSQANTTINEVMSRIREIVSGKLNALQADYNTYNGYITKYCTGTTGQKTLENDLKTANQQLDRAKESLSQNKIAEAISYAKSAFNALENVKNPLAECLVGKADEEIRQLKRDYGKLLPKYSDYYNTIIPPLESKLKNAKTALSKENYDNAISLAVEVIEGGKFNAIKEIILEHMKKKLGANGTNVDEKKLKELEKRYEQVQKRLEKARKNKPAISIISADDKLREAEEKLNQVNASLIVLNMQLKAQKAYLKAQNAQDANGLIAAVNEFESAISVISKETGGQGQPTASVAQVESLLNDASKSIDDAESRYTWNKVLLAVIALLLLAGLGYGGYIGYTKYQDKKRVDRAREAVEIMEDIIERLQKELESLNLLTDEGVTRKLSEMRRLVSEARAAFERGDYRRPLTLKEKFLSEYEVLNLRIAPYKQTLNVDITKHVAAKSYIGRRQNNEDAYIVEKVGGNILLAVADGMGGHLAGEVASKKATEILKETLKHNKFADPEEVFREAIKRANEVIYQMGHDPAHPEWYNMGTTLTAAIVRGNTATVANIGDSRTYLIRPDGSIKRITKDHSLVQELIDKGEITPEEARKHPQKNVITKALGISQTITIGRNDIKKVGIQKGDYLLLCSDGLSDALPDSEIARTVLAAPSLEEAVKILVEKAYGYGSDDNITVVLYRH
ncbi:Serine/threonine protein phosphatase 2C (PP2C) [Thermococcus sp. 4557]|uniref:Stp1/IreP family PP2C-type Ser/Thr phosphatase n=1 Tax=Thermococcus sp. (strain CGMCC 1.5172 / 4557) TaxID=1042877 RepID=UPI000219E309|nr:Stp1/IreP family PP2C-type Ser/Thr phosphatase [Thermococcus sp. 4557]AEK71921.1 Serine/threonine protein phosphatase 2C (PP2C) [Thermococcus sp. 4557]